MVLCYGPRINTVMIQEYTVQNGEFLFTDTGLPTDGEGHVFMIRKWWEPAFKAKALALKSQMEAAFGVGKSGFGKGGTGF